VPMRMQHNVGHRRARITRMPMIVGVLVATVIQSGCGGSTLPPSASTTNTATASSTSAVVQGATVAGSVVPTGTTPANSNGAEGTCAGVRTIAADSAEGQAIGQAIVEALPADQPPDLQQLAPFEFDEVQSIEQIGDRIVVQASFTRGLEPAIFVLRATASGYQYDTVGWSGQAGSVAEVRDALRRELPDSSAALVSCLQISDWFVG
jgi:hypothetical protein